MSDQSLSDLLKIFTIKKKGELKKHCRSITISKTDFANLIWASELGELPWLHRAHHRDFQPDHLQLTGKDRAAIASNALGPAKPAARKALNKISTMFDERRLLSGHIFFTPAHEEWHLFYFDQRDHSERNNHWEGGAHIHLLNYLWPQHTVQEVWNKFCTGNPQMSGAVHIKFQRTA